jgi:hypothetical protein
MTQPTPLKPCPDGQVSHSAIVGYWQSRPTPNICSCRNTELVPERINDWDYYPVLSPVPTNINCGMCGRTFYRQLYRGYPQ